MVERENLINREQREVEAEVTIGPISTNEVELYSYTPIYIDSVGPQVPAQHDMINLGNKPKYDISLNTDLLLCATMGPIRSG